MLFLKKLICLITVHERNRQTNRQTDRITMAILLYAP